MKITRHSEGVVTNWATVAVSKVEVDQEREQITLIARPIASENEYRVLICRDEIDLMLRSLKASRRG